MGTRAAKINWSICIFGAVLSACVEPDVEQADDYWTNETRTSTDELRKGQGGTNGDFDYCDGPNLCLGGEGDCDSNAECTGGAVCGHDNGPAFGMPKTWDVCVAVHCTNGVVDADEEAPDCGGADCGLCNPVSGCVGANGDADYCTRSCRCTTNGSGDCDSDLDCGPGLVCKINIGDSFGMPANYDVCVAAHCRDNMTNADETGRDCGGADCQPCAVVPGPCGNGTVTGSEACDDGNLTNGDGCSSTCVIEGGYSCVGEPSVCTPSSQTFTSCDDGYLQLNLGFPFKFFASKPPASTIFVSTNGRIFFSNQGAAMSSFSNTSLPTGSGNDFLAWWWDDFSFCSAPASFSFTVTGASPNRVARLVFSNFGPFLGGPGQTANAEVRLLEGGTAEVVYGTNAIPSLSGTVGVENAAGTATTNNPFSCNPNCGGANWPAGTTYLFPQQP